MSLNNDTGTTYSSALLIADTYQLTNGSCDSLPPFTLSNGFPVSACLELQSTLGALLLPRMTTAQRDDLNAYNGMMIYNITEDDFNFYEDGAWVGIPGVILPTVANDIAIFSDASGTLADSGVRLLFSSIENDTNLMVGQNAGNANLNDDTGTTTTIFGNEILSDATGSTATAALGTNIAPNIGTIDSCVFIGEGVAFDATGNLQDSIGIGWQALKSITTGADKLIAIGNTALEDATTVTKAVAVGHESLSSITDDASGEGAVGVGDSTFSNATQANLSVALGMNAGMNNTQYNNCLLLGAAADTSQNNLTAATAIGPGAVVGASNSMVLGALATKVGVNTTTPGSNFDLQGTLSVKHKIVEDIEFPYSITDSDHYLSCFPSPATDNRSIILPLITNANVGRRYVISCRGVFLTDINVLGTSGQPVGNVLLQASTTNYSCTYIAFPDATNPSGFAWFIFQG